MAHPPIQTANFPYGFFDFGIVNKGTGFPPKHLNRGTIRI
jgi:hypothetical protein